MYLIFEPISKEDATPNYRTIKTYVNEIIILK